MLNKCPHCKKITKYTNENKFRPFCSEKCKLIDFGAWASEEFQISSDKIKSGYDENL